MDCAHCEEEIERFGRNRVLLHVSSGTAGCPAFNYGKPAVVGSADLDWESAQQLHWYACAPDVLEAGAQIAKSGYLPCYAIPRLECGDDGVDHLHGLPLMLAATLDQIRDDRVQYEREFKAEVAASIRARIAESEAYPAYCLRHGRLLKWMPAPGWWYHAVGLDTCHASLNRKAPTGDDFR